MPKKSYIVSVFDHIAPTYDRLNHLLSLNIDKSWRRKAVQDIMKHSPSRVLDVACGTGDFSIALAKAGVPCVMGVDISERMMEIGRRKIAAAGLDGRVEFQLADCEALGMPDETYDAVTVAFGVRNFEHLEQGLREMHRVLAPGGKVCVLELSVPQNPFLLWLYKLYFLHVLPWVGGLISGQKDAYRYLPASVLRFPRPARFAQMLSGVGFHDVETRAFTLGLCRLFVATR